MDRKKAPALTSPWKVGFLVALMLVVTGLGVSYLITDAFGVKWTWLTINGPSPLEWSFNLTAFLAEMAPVAGLITLLAIASHVLVSGAVRRYKGNVDSGSEYKQLLRSIKTMEDLEDEDKIEKLKQHPELREFLMGLKHRTAARDKQGGERRAPEAPAARPQSLSSETAILTSAIMNGRDGFAQELALSIPELKQVERAVRQCLNDAARALPAPAPVVEAPAVDNSGPLRDQIENALAIAAAVRRDADACVAGGRELERAVAALRQGGAPGAGAPAKEVMEVAQRLEAQSASLSALGEEARRIAISSALQASGSTDADAIQVAEGIRGIATKFNTLATHWKETGPLLRRVLEGAANAATDPQRAGVAQTAAAVASKASLWNERLVALAEQTRALDRALGGEAAAAPAVAEAPEPVAEWNDVAEPAASPEPVAVAATAAEVSPSPQSIASDDDGFVTQSGGSVFANAAVADNDGLGFEKEKRFFADLPGKGAAEPAVAHIDIEPAPEPAAAPEAHADAPDDSFLTGPRQTVVAKQRDASRPVLKHAAPMEIETTSRVEAATATLDPDADAMDLYALGAVDFDASVHA